MTTTTETPIVITEITPVSESKKRPRRTYKDVESGAYRRGWQEGREAARQEYEEAYRLLSKHSNDLLLEVHTLREQLANISLRRLAWQRIKGLFAGYGRSESNNELFDDWDKK
jgi:hypothetical protein